jgi:hypothetical protein
VPSTRNIQSEFLCLFDSLNCHTRNQSRSCISRSTSQSHSLSDSISQRASLFTYHLVCPGYSPAPPSQITLIITPIPVKSPTDYVTSGSGSVTRTDTFAILATDPIPLTLSRTCHRHVTLTQTLSQSWLPQLFLSTEGGNETSPRDISETPSGTQTSI